MLIDSLVFFSETLVIVNMIFNGAIHLILLLCSTYCILPSLSFCDVIVNSIFLVGIKQRCFYPIVLKCSAGSLLYSKPKIHFGLNEKLVTTLCNFFKAIFITIELDTGRSNFRVIFCSDNSSILDFNGVRGK